MAFYTRILKMGFNVWACDADTAWMAHPAPFVNEYPMQYADMLTTTDCIDIEGDTQGESSLMHDGRDCGDCS